ncbi:MAG TPA: hypothetical protein VG033_08680 [Candidatus Acidoferrales bacterium]|jgi:hypothetical protein|nr:hypothetical protein [Candidatus Acidoferrales bacterium]
MRRGKAASVAVAIGLAMGLAIGLAAVGAAGQGFKVYPGAKKFTPPENETAKTLPTGTEETVYLTEDSFDKVAAFYKGIGKEYVIPGVRKNVKLPTGQEMRTVFIIFDGAADLKGSKSWLKVQRPYVGQMKMKGETPEYKDIRDVTAIVVIRKK